MEGPDTRGSYMDVRHVEVLYCDHCLIALQVPYSYAKRMVYLISALSMYCESYGFGKSELFTACQLFFLFFFYSLLACR